MQKMATVAVVADGLGASTVDSLHRRFIVQQDIGSVHILTVPMSSGTSTIADVIVPLNIVHSLVGTDFFVVSKLEILRLTTFSGKDSSFVHYELSL